MKITGLQVPDGFAGTLLSSTMLIENREYSRRVGYFWFALDHNKDSARLNHDQARQLRDELTAFLGDDCYAANEALRRDNADLTAQKDRLIKENVRLREAERARDALLAKHDAIARENTALRQRVASLEKDNADLTVKWNNLVEDEARLREENARLKVDLMNARAQHADLRRDFVNLYGDRIKPILTIALSCDTQDL